MDVDSRIAEYVSMGIYSRHFICAYAIVQTIEGCLISQARISTVDILVLKHSFHFSGSMGTAGRECNKTSMDTDGCDIMCCGRGYTTDVIQRVDKCECKFHWCCEVICKNCTKTVERHTCNGPNPTPPPRVKNNYIRFKRDDGL